MNSAPEPTIRPATRTDADAVFRLLRDFATTCRPDPARHGTVTFPQVLRAAAESRAGVPVADFYRRLDSTRTAACLKWPAPPPPPRSPAPAR
ncbi:hypothetical protein M2163_003687 [Streptomyces sp. SAI-135]|uniref:hypothetical protein n=1 Tax=unclassified Streptomyces TaxID=2593676 RepID=UPI0024738332|nr:MULTISPECIES: hypothetical protein [unclassified Streptomyces]MDH6519329.1 hypothetical protein [Streptomyces sp. SAI-090]MDH6551553.1 hypothetical protein [Streptomyces sp. SAI-041]MDH6584391.1 hypothetical protein [Streptomyces sp. SAI-133]MDH6616579.1 hypothetical protein [Streptomyces sp. SAI-135]